MSDGDRRKVVSVALGADAWNLLRELAIKRTREGKGNVFASDLIREAVQEYLSKRGFDIEVEVDRGGYRGEKEDKE